MTDDLYLPDDCWEYVFRFLNFDLPDECWDCSFRFIYDYSCKLKLKSLKHDLQSLSVVSKQFLSITNRLRSTITITDPTRHCLARLFQRFPNLTSLNLTSVLWIHPDRRQGFCWISTLANGVQENSNSKLKSLHMRADPWFLGDEGIRMLASVFPNLQLLHLSYCFNIHIIASVFPNLQFIDLSCCYFLESISHVLRSCSSEIRHLDLTRCERLKLHEINFELPKLEVLNLSETKVDDETLHVISKNCCRLLKLSLEWCSDVTEKGVQHAIENCTQLRKINLRCCVKVHQDVLASLILSRPSLRKIKVPYLDRFSDTDIELLSRQGYIIS